MIAIFALLFGLLPFGAAQNQSGSSSASDHKASQTSGPAQTKPDAVASVAQKKHLLRIGIAQVRSIVSMDLATDGWQQELLDDFDFLGAKGVILSADPEDRDATLEEAKQANCDYAVLTTVINFKSVGVGEKIGSVLGRGGLGGVGGTAQGRVDISAEAKVFQPDNSVPIFDTNEDFRQNDPAATARGLLHTEARDVMLEIKKLQANKQSGGSTKPPSSH